MSNAVLKGHASGTGTVTLETPNTNSDRTIALPDSNGTVMVSGANPTFSAYGSTTQSVSNGTWTKVVLNNKDFDTANCFDNVTNYRFQPTIAGYYQISACLNFAAATAFPNNCIVSIYKNNAQCRNASLYVTSGATSNNLSVSSVIIMNGTTDYIELFGYMGGATNGQFANSQTGTFLSASLIRAA